MHTSSSLFDPAKTALQLAGSLEFTSLVRTAGSSTLTWWDLKCTPAASPFLTTQSCVLQAQRCRVCAETLLQGSDVAYISFSSCF
jgi:hypothetical protein